MTIQQSNQPCDQAITLLFIERDQAAEQVAEQLEMIGYEERKAAPMILRGKRVLRVSTFGLTGVIQRVSINVA